MDSKTTVTTLRRSSAIAALACCCMASIGATSAGAQQSPPLACAQHTVVNGVHRQPTMADLEAALAICGVSSPVDTSPEFGRAIDEINNTLLDAPRN
ncbi:MAG TPA: hypothetical protein VGP48_12425 [Stellaceae bacterium]|jgi:hypothetical protein|nr:hypothetical protein [Stellaceae bacterium]